MGQRAELLVLLLTDTSAAVGTEGTSIREAIILTTPKGTNDYRQTASRSWSWDPYVFKDAYYEPPRKITATAFQLDIIIYYGF